MSNKEYYKQRLMEELNKSRQTEARRLTAMIGKGRPQETAGSDPTRISLAGLGSGTDPRNRAIGRAITSAFGNPESHSDISGMVRARDIRTYAAIYTLGSNAHY